MIKFRIVIKIVTQIVPRLNARKPTTKIVGLRVISF